jgi:hypothetical protein
MKLFKLEYERLEKVKETEQQIREEREMTLKMSIQGFNDLLGSFVDISNIQYQNDLNNFKQSKEDGFLTEEQYQNKVKALRQKQFEENKKYQVAQAIMNAAQAIINAATITPASAVPAAVFFATALGVANLAKIQAVEAPSFKKGTLNFKGGNVDADGGRMAVLHPNEAVIPADRNKDYHPTIKALFNRQIRPSEINGFVEARLRGRIDNRVNANIDTAKLSKAMKGNGSVELSNAKVVGKVIANELSKRVDIRRI